MDFKQIQELVKMVNKSNISELSIEEDKFKITIKQKDNEVQQVITVPAVAAVQAVAPAATAAVPVATATVPVAGTPVAPAKADNLVTVKSPMIGTFYRSPGPDKAAFVNVGDDITPGKVVCIIEAMKLFNEIESEVSGKIIKVLVDDASPVEYDQPLFLVEP
ncbi:acetyl-CoA carboxylase biotin carboxyl carrier protein [Chitinophaga agrisoli]|uniref:Biotin carboxyl carrier protein of acetyl-CoA carboxylase n=1 Tax=Chitinophaga agrisoli TaxID=2607653 RepID=A0A5B2VPE2_9BACT|nr:acetyl-CoA carboxylase biotin carboxyl carrier protein [Chitinophaga agrisoli]KAA2241603.1 acetyl-CoA carboxylase biotin carboxyl carrier protein [Chitinophaga agrisoli]